MFGLAEGTQGVERYRDRPLQLGRRLGEHIARGFAGQGWALCRVASLSVGRLYGLSPVGTGLRHGREISVVSELPADRAAWEQAGELHDDRYELPTLALHAQHVGVNPAASSTLRSGVNFHQIFLQRCGFNP